VHILHKRPGVLHWPDTVGLLLVPTEDSSAGRSQRSQKGVCLPRRICKTTHPDLTRTRCLPSLSQSPFTLFSPACCVKPSVTYSCGENGLTWAPTGAPRAGPDNQQNSQEVPLCVQVTKAIRGGHTAVGRLFAIPEEIQPGKAELTPNAPGSSHT
jgi:hypothetical protein